MATFPNIFPKRQPMQGMQGLDMAQLMALLGQQEAPQAVDPPSAALPEAPSMPSRAALLQAGQVGPKQVPREAVLKFLEERKGRLVTPLQDPFSTPEAKAHLTTLRTGETDAAKLAASELLKGIEKSERSFNLFGGRLAPYVKAEKDLSALTEGLQGPMPMEEFNKVQAQEMRAKYGPKAVPFVPGEEPVPPGMSTEQAKPIQPQDASSLLGEQRETPFPDFMPRTATGQQRDSFQPQAQGAPQDDGSGADFNQLVQSSAQEAVQKGVKTPEQAEQYLRIEFEDDPYIESALQEAKSRYEDARRRSAEPPSVLDFIGYTLAALAFGNPMAASEVFGRRGEKREDEARALEQLLGAQGMKVRDRQMKGQMANQTAIRMEDVARMLHRDQAKAEMRQHERGQDREFQGLKSGRGAALQQLNQLRQQQSFETDPKRKAALQPQIEALQKRVQWFNQNLGEPDDNEIGMDVQRLLGLG